MENNSQKQALLQVGKLLSEFLKHLAGDHSDEWLQAFKKFLRKENPWGESKETNLETNYLNFENCTQKTAMRLAEWLPQVGCFATYNNSFWRAASEFNNPFVPEIKGFGILLGERKYKIPLLKLFKIRRTVLGVLYFEGSKWTLEGYGEKYIPKMEELRKEIEKKFNVTVCIKLEDLIPKEEAEEFPWDAAGYSY